MDTTSILNDVIHVRPNITLLYATQEALHNVYPVSGSMYVYYTVPNFFDVPGQVSLIWK